MKTINNFESIKDYSFSHKKCYQALLSDFIIEVKIFRKINHLGGADRRSYSASRAARLSAAVKRYKTAKVIDFIIEILKSEHRDGYLIDITPIFCKNLSQNLFDRVGSQKIYVDLFSTKDRKHKNENKPAVSEYLIKKYRDKSIAYIKDMDSEIETVKVKYSLEKSKG